MSMNEKYENTAVELKHIVEAKLAMEQQFTEDNNSLRKELQKQVYSSISWKVHHLKIETKICKAILTRWKNIRSVLKHNYLEARKLASELKEKEESINVLINNQTRN